MIPLTRELHSHTNKAVLDAITAALMEDLQGLQQFKDKTVYDIQTVNEEILNLQQYKHLHNNQAVLDRITEEMIDAVADTNPRK